MSRLADMFEVLTEAKRHETVQLHSMTLPRFILAEQRKSPKATGEFSQLMYAIQTAVKSTASLVRRVGLLNSFQSGKTVPAFANTIAEQSHNSFLKLLTMSYSTCMIISKCSFEPIQVEPEYQGKYLVCLDPIDSLENLQSYGTPGSLFSVYRRGDKAIDSFQRGSKQVAAGYAVYGCKTLLVLTLGQGLGVYGFTFNPNTGEFVLTEPLIVTPTEGKIFTIDGGKEMQWEPITKEYVKRKKDAKAGKFKIFRMTGSLVSDVHRIIIYGGIYMCPSTMDNIAGSTCLLYGANPLALVVRESGGLATTGQLPVLEVLPESYHQTIPFFIGSRHEISSFWEMIAIDKITN